MTLGLELGGAFVAGIGVCLVGIAVGGRWYLRRKFGGMLDLLTPPQSMKMKAPEDGPFYSTSPSLYVTKTEPLDLNE